MPRRAFAPWVLAPPIIALHLVLSSMALDDAFGWGAQPDAARRITVAFVHELQPAAPPVPVPPRRRARVAAAAAPPAATPPAAAASAGAAASADAGAPAAASAAAVPPDARQVTPAQAAQAAGDVSGAASSAALAAADGVAAAGASASAPIPAAATVADRMAPDSPPAASAEPEVAAVPPAPAPTSTTAFEWPPSTRLSYTLSGNYRGPVQGQARVQWLLAGERYQVQMEVSIGPAFAPLISRRLSSDGVVTAQGLQPRHFDEETHVALRAPRRLSIALDAERVRLPTGREVDRPQGVQDSASQFVQMTWLFTTRPQLLQPGQSIELPLALPRHVELWTYDVVREETLATPVGRLQAFHVQPRRAPRPGGDLVAEFWVAPTLQYLPVRIVIRQDAETFVDLLLERLPLQAERR